MPHVSPFTPATQPPVPLVVQATLPTVAQPSSPQATDRVVLPMAKSPPPSPSAFQLPPPRPTALTAREREAQRVLVSLLIWKAFIQLSDLDRRLWARCVWAEEPLALVAESIGLREADVRVHLTQIARYLDGICLAVRLGSLRTGSVGGDGSGGGDSNTGGDGTTGRDGNTGRAGRSRQKAGPCARRLKALHKGRQAKTTGAKSAGQGGTQADQTHCNGEPPALR